MTTRERTRSARLAALVLGLVLVAAACGEDQPARTGSPTSPDGELVAQVASYDLAVGERTRLIVGLLTPDNRFVSGGTATFRLSLLGAGDPEVTEEVEASFLAVPGEEPAHEHAEAGPATEGRGVYSAMVAFDRPGTWQVEVVAEVDGEPRSGIAAFGVREEPAVPAVGEPALRTRNLTLADAEAGEAPLAAVDSRADADGEVAYPELHDTTIAAALRRGHPILAVFATPAYCVSQFCGPITDMIADLADDYGDRAEFLHVEIWRDFQNQVVNRAAADWLLRDDDLREPWVFLIDADGVIAARWDNVATRQEIEPHLQDLPPFD